MSRSAAVVCPETKYSALNCDLSGCTNPACREYRRAYQDNGSAGVPDLAWYGLGLSDDGYIKFLAEEDTLPTQDDVVNEDDYVYTYAYQGNTSYLIKLGYSEHGAEARIKGIRPTFCSESLTLLGEIYAPPSLEGRLKRELQEYNKVGEWYYPGYAVYVALQQAGVLDENTIEEAYGGQHERL